MAPFSWVVACVACFWCVVHAAVQKPMCAGCTNNAGPGDCYYPCQEKGGYCGSCNSIEGTLGACCQKGVAWDPPECKIVPEANFQYSGYHECVLVPTTTTTTTTTLTPSADDPGHSGPCFEVCENKGYCTACDSASGKKGACCMWMSELDPAECQNLPDENFFNGKGNHVCVLTKATTAPTAPTAPTPVPTVPTPMPTPTMEEPMCTGCTNQPFECWAPCQKGGYCSACNSASGTPGACCRKGHSSDPAECQGLPDSSFKYSGYHVCVLTTAPTPVPTAPTPVPTAPTPVPTAPTPVPTAPTPVPTTTLVPAPTPPMPALTATSETVQMDVSFSVSDTAEEFFAKFRTLVVTESKSLGRRLLCAPMFDCLSQPFEVSLTYTFDLPADFGDAAKVVKWAKTQKAVDTINTKILDVYNILPMGRLKKADGEANGNTIDCTVTFELTSISQAMAHLSAGIAAATQKNAEAAAAAKDTIMAVAIPGNGVSPTFEEVFNALLLVLPKKKSRRLAGGISPSLEEIIGDVLSVPVTPRPRRLATDEVKMKAILTGGDADALLAAAKKVTPDQVSEGITASMTAAGLDPADYADMKPKSLSEPKAVVGTIADNTDEDTAQRHAQGWFCSLLAFCMWCAFGRLQEH